MWLGVASQCNYVAISSNLTTMSNLLVTGKTTLSNLTVGVGGAIDQGALNVTGTLTSVTLSNTGTFSNAGNAVFGSSVGVGTSTPAYPLDVVGNARVSGSISVPSCAFTSTTTATSFAMPPTIAYTSFNRNAFQTESTSGTIILGGWAVFSPPVKGGAVFMTDIIVNGVHVPCMVTINGGSSQVFPFFTYGYAGIDGLSMRASSSTAGGTYLGIISQSLSSGTAVTVIYTPLF